MANNIKGRNMLVLFAILGALITVGTAIIQWHEKKKAENDSQKNKQIAEQKQRELEDANIKILSLQNQTIDSLKTISDLQNKLLQENKHVYDLQNHLLMEQTGGDLEPILKPITFGDIHPNSVGLIVYNNGNYPIYDVTVRITDLAYLSKIDIKMPSEEKQKILQMHTLPIRIGTINKSSGTDPIELKVDPAIQEVSYNFSISWRNGMYSGHIAFARDERHFFIVKIFTPSF